MNLIIIVTATITNTKEKEIMKSNALQSVDFSLKLTVSVQLFEFQNEKRTRNTMKINVKVN